MSRGVGASLGGQVALGHPPGAVEGLPDDGVVGFLGDGSLAPLVEGGEVILDKADHPLLGAAAGRDGEEQVGVGHEIRVHLQQRALLQNEGGKNHLERKETKGHEALGRKRETGTLQGESSRGGFCPVWDTLSD